MADSQPNEMSHSMAEMSSKTQVTDHQTPLHLQYQIDSKEIPQRHCHKPNLCSKVSPNRRRRHSRPIVKRACNNSPTSKSRIRTASSMGICSRKFVLICCCIYLFSATGGGSTDVASSSDGEQQGNKKRFLRTAVAATASENNPVDSLEIESELSDGRRLSDLVVTEPSPTATNEEEEEFDYETYHTKHNIPVPALGATMMGLMNTNTATASSNTDITTAATANANIPPQNRMLKEEQLPIPRGILAFAGTSAAMKSFASEMDGDGTEKDSSLDEDEENNEMPISKNTNTMMFESTLAQISKSRYSLLYGLDSTEDEEEVDAVSEDTIKSMSNTQLLKTNDFINKEDGSLNKKTQSSLNNNQSPKLSTSGSDLDSGRHLVGLEIREVRPHQQIIIDYQDASDTDSEEQTMRPLRIKYMLSDNVKLDTGANQTGELKNNHAQLLSTLLDTSFNRTSSLWSQALSLPPVVGNIVPTVAKCGGARIPALHREKGVENADIVIYISGDNRYCGGALMHSAICDFDQHMRPLVSNINICTKNIPTTKVQGYGKQILNEVLAKYDGYISTETSRILGASTSLFRHYHNPDTGAPYGSSEKQHASCVDGTEEAVLVPNVISEEIDTGTGQVYYEIRTPKVIEVVRNHFDCMTLTGARLEVKKGGLSCFGGFLDERLFFGEQVLGFQVMAPNQGATISPLTLALLEDSSWYIANYTVSSEVVFGRGAGCQFAHGSCAVNDDGAVQISAQGKGFHCADIGTMGCDISHSFKAKCDLLHLTSSSVSSSHDLSRGHDDVCPMHVRGAIDCIQGSADPTTDLPGEVYGKSSKCFLTDDGQPICLQGTCNEEKQSIDIHYEDEVFTCARDGQIIDTKKGMRIECPRIAAVCPSLICPSNCSGRGVCDEDREGKHSCICDDPFDESPGCWGQ